MITENLSTLKIHKLTQTQYDRELEAGRIDENAIYLTPDNIKPVYEYAQDCGYIGSEEQFAKVFSNPTGISEPTLLKLVIKPTTDPATSLHIQDSAKYRVLDIGMSGKTEQNTTQGNQLANIPDCEEFTRSGLTLSCKNGVIKVKGTSINLVATNLSDIGFDAKGMVGTYFISESEGNNAYIIVAVSKDGKTTWHSNKSFTLDGTESQVLVYCQIPANTTVDLELYPMLNAGTSALPFEPYTCGIPSPNKDFPQEITHAGRYNEETGRYEVDVDVCNKNFYKPTIFSTHQCTARLEKDKYIFENTETTGVVVVKNELLTLKKGITYRLSLHDVVNVDRVIVWENGDVNKPLGDARATYTFTCTPTENMKIRCGIYMKDISIIGNVAECRIQIEQGTTTTPYIPHESQKVTLSSPRPLTKWDNLVKVNGKWYWDYKQLKLVVNGNAGWAAYSIDTRSFYVYNILSETSNRREGCCNQLRVDSFGSNMTNCLWIGISNKSIYIAYSDFYDESLEDKGLANLKAHLNEHPLEIYTYKDESELVPLPDEEQTLLNNLETYYGVTNVYNEQGCPMWLEYVADTKLYMDNKLLAIQSAVI